LIPIPILIPKSNMSGSSLFSYLFDIIIVVYVKRKWNGPVMEMFYPLLSSVLITSDNNVVGLISFVFSALRLVVYELSLLSKYMYMCLC
jgi:hypothetical protein